MRSRRSAIRLGSLLCLGDSKPFRTRRSKRRRSFNGSQDRKEPNRADDLGLDQTLCGAQSSPRRMARRQISPAGPVARTISYKGETGDSMHFDTAGPHQWRNSGDLPSKALFFGTIS